jgi:hypothetical protein
MTRRKCTFSLPNPHSFNTQALIIMKEEFDPLNKMILLSEFKDAVSNSMEERGIQIALNRMSLVLTFVCTRAVLSPENFQPEHTF